MRDWNAFYSKKPGFYEQSADVAIQVKEALKYCTFGKTLDLGCGEGKNSLFLAENGYDVTAVDISDVAIERLRKKATEKNLSIACFTCSAEDFVFQSSYHFVLCNYLLHFLQKSIGLDLIKRIQDHTEKSGVNLISGFRDEPPFFTAETASYCYFQHEELIRLYTGWTVHWYKEPVGPVLKKDENGNPLQQKRAIIIAQKA